MKYIVGISEIVLWTADKEKALHFYRDLLGLEVIWTPADPEDSLTETDLMTTYPELRSI